MPTSYEEWKNYDPDDPIYLSTAERAQKDLEAGLGHAKKWLGSVGSDVGMGAAGFAAGTGLRAIGTSVPKALVRSGLPAKIIRRIPWAPARVLGTGLQWLGGTQMSWAPILATRQTIDDITKPVEPPQTDAQHLKKWFKNTGTGVGIGLGIAGAGKAISLIPGAQIVGLPLMGAGLMAAKFAPVESTIELGIDKLFRNGKPRPTPPPPEKKDYTPNIYGAAIPGAAGLVGGYALTGLIPAIRRRKMLRMALAAAAAAGAGYWGWKETDKAKQLNNIA